jgi:hypothetical protein
LDEEESGDGESGEETMDFHGDTPSWTTVRRV